MSCNVGIDNIPFVDTWHGKPGIPLPPQHSSAENGASGLIAGLPSSTYSARNASACSCCVAAHRGTPCWFGVIADHLPPRPTNPLTQRSSVIPSGYRGLPLPQRRRARRNDCPRCRPGQRNQPRAPNSGGGPLCMPLCFWATLTVVAASVFLLGLRGQNLHHTSHPTLLPHVSNWPTSLTSVGSHYTTIPPSLCYLLALHSAFYAVISLLIVL